MRTENNRRTLQRSLPVRHLPLPKMFLLSALLLALVRPARASKLDYGSWSQAAGDNLTAPVANVSSGDGGVGWTPNITVEYYVNGALANWVSYGAGYGDLSNIIYPNPSAAGWAAITLRAASGKVRLHGFDFGEYYAGQEILTYLCIKDSGGSVLTNAASVSVPKVGHNSMAGVFGAGVTFADTALTIEFATAYPLWGVGLDNIVFEEVYPTPTISTMTPNAGPASVQLNGNLSSLGYPPSNSRVWVYWGTQDGTTNPAAGPRWAHTNYLGSYAATGLCSTNLTGLTAGTRYYHRFAASNTAGFAWASTTRQFALERFAPTNLPNCMLWLRADKGVTTSGSDVTQWADQSGNGHYAEGTTSPANRPVLNPVGLNGLPTIDFTSANNDWLTMDTTTYGFQHTFIVYRDTAAADYCTPLGTVYNAGAAFHGDSASPYTIFNATYTLAATRNGSNYMNGVSIGNGTGTSKPAAYSVMDYRATSAFTATHRLQYIGTDPGGTTARDINGGIAEIVMYTRALTEGERQKVGYYLQQRYGIAGSYFDPTLPAIAVVAATNVTLNSATLRASLTRIGSDSTNVHVWAYWGTADGGDNSGPVKWAHTNYMGARDATGVLSTNLSGMATGVQVSYRFFASNSVGTAWTAAQTFVPSLPASVAGLQFWVAADLGVQLSGSDVTLWRDLSGNNRHMVPPNASYKPTLISNWLNGKPVVDFDYNDYMASSNASWGSLPTFFIVCRVDTTESRDAYGRILDFGPALDNHFVLCRNNTTDQYWWNYANTSGSTGYGWRDWDLISIWGNGVNAYIEINSPSAQYSRAAGAFAAGTTPLYVGANQAGNAERLAVEVAEIIVFNRELAASERRKVASYLDDKYGMGAYYTDPQLPKVLNAGASAVTRTGATLNAQVVTNGSSAASVWVVWGDEDAGADTNAWDHLLSLGQPGAGIRGTNITGIAADKTYYYRVYASNTAGAVWSPHALAFSAAPLLAGAGLRVWLDGADKVSQIDTTDAGYIEQWSDKSGSGLHFTQTTLANKPIKKWRTAQGFTSVLFDGDQVQRVPGDVLSANDDDFTYIAAFQKRDVVFTGTGAIFGQGAYPPNNQRAELFWGTSHNVGMIGNNNDVWTPNSSAMDQQWHVVDLERNNLLNPNNTFRVNGALYPLLNAGAGGAGSLAVGTTRACVGANYAGNAEWFYGEIAEIMAFSRELTAAERNAIGFYLQQKLGRAQGYAAPTGAPWIRNGGVTTLAGQSAVQGELLSAGEGSARVFLYWGAGDGGTTPGSWANVADFGWRNAGGLSTNLATSDAYVYYCRFAASNAVSGGLVWADSSIVFSRTPLAVGGANLKLWLDANDPATLTLTGTEVTDWADKSGNGNHLTRREAARVPTSGEVKLNGANTLFFQYGDAMYRTASVPLALNDDDFTYIAVVKGLYGTGDIMGQAAAANNNAMLLRWSTDGNLNFIGWGNDIAAGVGTVPYNTWKFLDADFNNTLRPNITLRVNGGTALALSSPQAAPSPNIGTTAFAIGCRGDGNLSDFYGGYYAEVLVFDKRLSAAERNAIGYYLQQKYGLPSGYVNPNVPVVANTGGASPVGSATARMNGYMTSDNGLATTVRIHWGDEDAGEGGAWDHVELIGPLSAPAAFFKDISGLTPGRTYYYRCSAQNAGGTGWSAVATAFTPGDVMAIGGLRLWLDAAETGTIVQASTPGFVERWLDKSGRGNDVVQYAAANKPATGTATLNGRNVLSFDGGDWLDGAAGPLDANDDDYTMVAVWKEAALGDHVLFGQGASLNNNAAYIHTFTHGALMGVGFLNWGGGNDAMGPVGSVPLNDWNEVVVQVDNVGRHGTGYYNLLWSLNGRSAYRYKPEAANMGVQSTFFRVGARHDGWGPHNGQVAELLMFDKLLTGDELNGVHHYLRQKYALDLSAGAAPAGPRVVNGSPSAVSTAGATANGTLEENNGLVTRVLLYWGDNDGGTGTWDHVTDLGNQPEGAVSQPLGGLTPYADCYYRFAASNNNGFAFAPRTSVLHAGPVSALGASLRLWLDASAADTIAASGGTVSKWADKSSWARDFDQPDAALRPTTGAATIGSRNALGLDATDGLWGKVAPLDWGDEDYTYIVVWQPATSGAGFLYGQGAPYNNNHSALVQTVHNATADSCALGLHAWGNNDYWYLSTYGVGVPYATMLEVDNTARFSGGASGHNLRLTQNGLVQYHETWNDPNNNTILNLGAYYAAVGRRSDSAWPYNGAIAEVIVADRVLTDDERNAIGYYLQQKYAFDTGYYNPAKAAARADAPSSVDRDSATLNGTVLEDNGIATTVYVFWGDNDAGAGGAWDYSQNLGAGAKGGSKAHPISGLTQGVPVYYRFAASNANGMGWAAKVQAFTPSYAAEVTGARLWLDANATGSLEGSGGTVSAWNDISGNGRRLEQPAPARRPQTGANSLNGKNVLTFDGSNDYLWMMGANYSTPGAPLAQNDDDFTYWMVWYPRVNNINMTLLAQGADTGNNRSVQLITGNALYGVFCEYNDVYPAPYTANSPFITQMTMNNAQEQNVTVVHNGTPYLGDSSGSASAINMDNYYVAVGGSRPAYNMDNNWFLNGDVAEVLVFDRVLTAPEANKVGFYLQQKYGVAAGYADPRKPLIVTQGFTVSGPTAATASGNLQDDGGLATRVWLYWGDNDGGMGGWDHTNSLGLKAVGTVDAALAGLTQDALYYYRFAASNTAGFAWATSSGRFVPSPASAISGLALWLDAGQPATIAATGSDVTQWQDLSGNGKDFAVVAAGRNPTTGVKSQNGRNVLTFAQAQNDGLSRAGDVLAFDDDDYTYVAVVRANTAGDYGCVYGQGLAQNNRRSELWYNNGNLTFIGHYNDYTSSGTAYPFAEWHIAALNIDNRDNNVANQADQHNVRLVGNGTRFFGRTSGGGPAVLQIYQNTAAVGCNVSLATGAEVFDGDIAEVLVYNRSLTVNEHSQVGAYLNTKWNLGRSYPLNIVSDRLVHRWSFTSDMNDSVGTAHGTGVNGNAAVSGGRLVLDGTGDWVQTAPLNRDLSEKTLMAWGTLNVIDQANGAALLGVQDGNATFSYFDAIVYEERTTAQWMSGSPWFVRTPVSNGGAAETVTGTDVMLSIVYRKDNTITLYRNGVLYAGPYSQGSLQTYVGGTDYALLGTRGAGAAETLNGSLNEARIYNYALSAAEIQSAYLLGPDTVADPLKPTIVSVDAQGRLEDRAWLVGNVVSTGAAASVLWVCWGDNNPGVNSTGAWDHVVALGTAAPGLCSNLVTGLSVGTTYYYRHYATNLHGEAWAPVVISFQPKDFPAQITGLALWLDASDASTITETGGLVSQWNDKSGAGKHVLQAADASKPTTGAATLNGRNVLTFDGGDWLDGASAPLALNDDQYTLLAVWKDAAAGDNVLFGQGASANNNCNYLATFANGALQGVGLVTWQTAAEDASPAGSVPLNTWNTLVAQVDNVAYHGTGYYNMLWTLNGRSVLRRKYEPTIMNLNTTFFRVGARHDGWGPHNGQIAELMVFDRLLTGDERSTLEYYLRQKYSLDLPSGASPRGPRVVNGAPSAVTTNGATLNGTLEDSNGLVTRVLLCWGDNDGGDGAWDHVEDLGNGSEGAVSGTLSGLARFTNYYYRFAASNANGLARAPRTSVFHPGPVSALGSSLRLWLDASASGTITAGGGAVSKWADKTSYARDFEQPDAALQPTTGSAAIGGRNAVGMDTTDGLWAKVAPLDWADDDYTYIVVWQPNNAGAGFVYGQGAPYNNNHSALVHTVHTAAADSCALGLHAWGTSDYWYLAPYGVGQPYATFLEVDNNARFGGGAWGYNLRLTQNGFAQLHRTWNDPGNGAILNLGAYYAAIGRRHDNAYPLNGSVAEVIVVDRVLSDDERNAIGYYLQQKYGFDTSYYDPERPAARADAPTGVDRDSATLNGTVLEDNGLTTEMWAFWGDDDAGAGGAWDHSQNLGVAVKGGVKTLAVGPLAPNAAVYCRFAASNANGMAWSRAARAFVPSLAAEVGGARLWLDASATGTLEASGGAVSAWNDISGSGRRYEQGTAARQPQTGANTLNGRNVLTFDGANDYLWTMGANQSVPGVPLSLNDDDYTYWAVWYPRVNNINMMILGQGNNANNNNAELMTGNTLYGFHARANDTWPVPYLPNAARLTQLTINNAQEQNATFVDNGTTYLGDTSQSAGLIHHQTHFGAIGGSRASYNMDSAWFLNGDIAELLVFDRNLTAAESAQIGWYLQQKWGIPAGYSDPDLPAIRSLAAGAVADTNATANGYLDKVGGSPTTVYLYWGDHDGYASPPWDHTNKLGPQVVGPINTVLTNLVSGNIYFYRHWASNATGTAWATNTVSFGTVGRPAVRTTAPAGVMATRATLTGALDNDGGSAVTAWVYWGDDNAGAGPWDHTNQVPGFVSEGPISLTITGLPRGTPHWYRYAGSNAQGFAWAPQTQPFTTGNWEPQDIAGLELWLDANNSSSVATLGGKVTAWNDVSGNSRHLDQYESDRPNYPAAGPNGTQVVNFDGNDFLKGTYNFDTLDAYTIIAVSRLTGALNGRLISSDTQNYIFGCYNGTVHDWHAGSWIYDSPTAADTAWHLHAGTLSGGVNPAASFWAEGNPLILNGYGSHDTLYKPGVVGLGGYQGSSEWSSGEVAELLVYSGVLSAENLNAVGYYLEAKWGLATAYYDPTVPGVATLAPTNITATSAQLRGRVTKIGTPPSATRVWVHWGDNDAGTGTWDHVTYCGTSTVAVVSTNLTGLVADTRYYYRFAASNAAALAWADTSATFVPHAFQALGGLKLWLRADSGVQTSGGAVTGWLDASGNGSHAPDPGAANRPSLVNGGAAWSSRDVVRMAAGSNQRLAGTFGSAVTGTKLTALIVGRVSAYGSLEGGYAGLFTARQTGNNDWQAPSVALMIENNNGSSLVTYRNTASTAIAPAANTAFIGVSRFDGAGQNMYLNGTAAAPSGGMMLSAFNLQEFLIGGRWQNASPIDDGQNWDGDLAEVLLFDRDLASWEMNQIGWYLQQKYGIAGAYGIPSAPAVRTDVPTNVAPSGAVFNGYLESRGTPETATRVWLYWGDNDGGTGAWDHTNSFGARLVGPLATNMTGLAYGTKYYYRFACSNDVAFVWAASSKSSWYGDLGDMQDLTLWLKSDTGVTTNASGQVTAWSDQSGLNHHAAGATGSYGTAPRLNFYPLVSVPVGGALAFQNGNVDAKTVFVVAKLNNSQENGGLIGRGGDFGIRYTTSGVRFQPAPGSAGSATDFSGTGGASTFKLNGVPGMGWPGATMALPSAWLILEAQRDPALGGAYFTLLGQYYAGRGLAFDVAEVIVFNRLLSAAEREAVGFYLEQKYDVQTPYADASRPAVDTAAASGGGTAWSLNGEVTSVGSATPVTARVYWGATNFGTRADLWGGAITVVPGLNAPAAVSTNVSGLAPSMQYFYRYAASNSQGLSWSPAGTNFFTEGAPVIETLAAAGIGSTQACARAQYDSDGGSGATVFLYWGDNAGDTPTPPAPGTWDHVAALNPQPAAPATIVTNLAGLAPGVTYHYRFAATNAGGVAWGSGEASFTTYDMTVPNDLGAVQWLKADAGVTAAGGAVSSWLDQTAHGNNASGGADGYGLPTHVAGALNGLPVVNFAADRCSFPGVTARTVLMVYKHNGYAQVANVAGPFSGATGSGANCLNHTTTDGIWNTGAFASGGELRVNNVVTPNHAAGAYHIVDVTGGPQSWNRLGGTDTDGEFANGDLAEFIVFDRLLGGVERNRIGYYLEVKYGLNTAYYNDAKPDISTTAASDLATTNVTVSGSVIYLAGGSEATVKLYYMAGSDGPWTHASPSATLPGTHGVGAVSHRLTGLTEGTLYYARYYLTNDVGESWGSSVAFSTPKLWHKWTFNDGTARDMVGSAHGTLYGTATIVGGRLFLSGSSGANRMETTAGAFGHATGFNKTLVAWFTLSDHTQNSPDGGPLSLGNSTWAQFDSIDYGERVAGQWCNGSDSFNRTPVNNGGASETLSEPSPIMMLIRYDSTAANRIQLYRNGVLYAQHNTVGTLQAYDANAKAMIGPRHLLNGYMNGYVDEARIYEGALGPTQIDELTAAGPDRPEIHVRQAATAIPDGGSFDLGSQGVDAGPAGAVTITVDNLGAGHLTFTGPPCVQNDNAAEFVVVDMAATPLAPLGSRTFTVAFDPSDGGVRTAHLTIGNSDADENPYNITLTGTGSSLTGGTIILFK